jgi:NitT/TauT family transport system substrate-binding protein
MRATETRLATLAAACALAASLTLAAAAEPEVKTIRFVGVPSANSMVVWIARDQGYFKEEGLELKAQNDLAAGIITDNILGGQADMVYGGVTTMLMPYSKGAPLASIATTDYDSVWELLVHQDSPYRKLEDLKGKTISVIAPNTGCVLSLRKAFEQNGWPKDFIKFTVVAPPDQVAAFGAKRVDGTCMFDPYRLQIKKQFGGRGIWSIAEAPVGSNVTGNLIVHRDFAAKNPNTVAAIQRAIGKAAAAANANPELIYAALAGALRQDIAAVREVTLPKYSVPPSRPNDVKEIADALYRYGFVTTPIDVAGFDRSELATGRK